MTSRDESRDSAELQHREPRRTSPDRGYLARQATMDVLRAVRDNEPFETAFGRVATRLEEADRRLVHEMSAGILRNRATLDALIVPRVTGQWRRVAEDVRDLLRVGAYQLSELARVPPHAAVAATVEVAKRSHGPRSAGFVNAVLRRLAKELASPDAPAATPPPTDDPRVLAKRYSHPAWMVARWTTRFGIERTEALLQHNNRRSAIHLQAAQWDAERLRQAFHDAGVPFEERDAAPGFAVRGVRVHELPGYAEGAFVVQDPAQALALDHAALPNGALLWDACAAPGGKAARLQRRGPVFASDPRRARLPRLIDTVRRAAPGVLVACADATAAPVRDESFDAVLLDVPCSATGTIAKHPDARWRLSPRRISRLSAIQATLLDAVARAVRPGGLLAYLTCSLEAEENDTQVDAFLTRHEHFRRTADDLFLFPPDRGTDGAFAARLERVA